MSTAAARAVGPGPSGTVFKVTKQTLPSKIAALIRERIKAGTYPVGSELPPMRTLAAEQDVSLGSVQQAIQQLVREGVLSTARGSGVEVISADGAEIRDIADVLDDHEQRLRAVEGTTSVDMEDIRRRLAEIERRLP